MPIASTKMDRALALRSVWELYEESIYAVHLRYRAACKQKDDGCVFVGNQENGRLFLYDIDQHLEAVKRDVQNAERLAIEQISRLMQTYSQRLGGK